MSLDHIQDRIRWGMNVAARNIGATTDAYRPAGVCAPTAPCNRYLRFHAAFTAPDNKFLKPSGYGSAIWHGVFDAAYTKVGDYLIQQEDIWFIAAQQALLPVLCVKAERVVSFSRSDAPASAGVNTYSGVTTATNTPLLTDWPASILGVRRLRHPPAPICHPTSPCPIGLSCSRLSVGWFCCLAISCRTIWAGTPLSRRPNSARSVGASRFSSRAPDGRSVGCRDGAGDAGVGGALSEWNRRDQRPGSTLQGLSWLAQGSSVGMRIWPPARSM